MYVHTKYLLYAITKCVHRVDFRSSFTKYKIISFSKIYMMIIDLKCVQYDYLIAL